MLTYNDFTVCNAPQIFKSCRDSKANYWGFKEHPLPLADMKQLYTEMKRCGKTTFLEVVAYSEDEGLAGAEMCAECGCDILMGTSYHDSIMQFCNRHNLRYMPFVGEVSGRPSILEGTIDGMIAQAREYIGKGAFGIDLLGYRYTGDAPLLNRTFVSQVPAPVCIAGSIDSYKRLDEVKEANPWAFTIGSAFFEGCFGATIREQIDKVCDYINQPVL